MLATQHDDGNHRLKEINLWMSSGGTVTSLHMDTSENVMHMIAGSKEFLLFRPNQIKHLHYESVPEIRYDDSSQGPGARINDIHGLVDPVSPNLVRFPDYKKAYVKLGPGRADAPTPSKVTRPPCLHRHEHRSSRICLLTRLKLSDAKN